MRTFVRIVTAAWLFMSTSAASGVDSEKTVSEYWPRLIRITLKVGKSMEDFKKFIALYGSKVYSGKPTIANLNSDKSYDLEIVDQSSSFSSRSWIEIAVPNGQEQAWMNLIGLNPSVDYVDRIRFTTKGADPKDLASLLRDVAAKAVSNLIPLPELQGISSNLILKEIDSFVRDDLIPGQHPLPSYEGNPDPSYRHVFTISNGRGVFMENFWQDVVYSFSVYDVNDQIYVAVMLQAKVAPGTPPALPPVGAYRDIDGADETASLEHYRKELEGRLIPRLEHLKK
jgi:hypothetical protein